MTELKDKIKVLESQYNAMGGKASDPGTATAMGVIAGQLQELKLDYGEELYNETKEELAEKLAAKKEVRKRRAELESEFVDALNDLGQLFNAYVEGWGKFKQLENDTTRLANDIAAVEGKSQIFHPGTELRTPWKPSGRMAGQACEQMSAWVARYTKEAHGGGGFRNISPGGFYNDSRK